MPATVEQVQMPGPLSHHCHQPACDLSRNPSLCWFGQQLCVGLGRSQPHQTLWNPKDLDRTPPPTPTLCVARHSQGRGMALPGTSASPAPRVRL